LVVIRRVFIGDLLNVVRDSGDRKISQQIARTAARPWARHRGDMEPGSYQPRTAMQVFLGLVPRRGWGTLGPESQNATVITRNEMSK